MLLFACYFLLVLHLGPTAAAQPPSTDETASRLPTLVDAPPVAYPEEALASGREGAVLLRLEVSSRGEVLRAEVVTPVGHGFDEAALEAVRNFRFEPALDATGTASSAVIEYRYTFTLEAVPVVSVSGEVRAAGSREPVPGARVTLQRDGAPPLTMSTDASGVYRFVDVLEGTYTLSARVPGFSVESARVTVADDERTEVLLYLRPARTWEQPSDDEMVVEGERIEPEVIERRLAADDIRMMPGTGGDIVRAVQSLPGVARSPFNAGQVVVRGTSPEDSAFTLGGAPLPVVFHFGGLSTVINSDALSEVAYMPGNYGVRYGRRLGGAIDLRLDKQLPERSWGYASIDLFQASLFTEAVLNDKWALLLSVRRSYLDTLLGPLVNTSASTSIRLPQYTDSQARLLRRGDDGSTLDMMLLYSSDRFSYTEYSLSDPTAQKASTIEIQFTKGWLQWQKVLPSGWLTELTLISGPEETSATYRGDDGVFDTRRPVDGAVVPPPLRSMFRFEAYRDVPVDGWSGWRLGIDYLAEDIKFRYDVGSFGSFTNFSSSESGEAQRFQPALYLEQTQRWGRLELVPGVRLDVMVLSSGPALSTLTPRFAFRYAATDDTRLRGSIGQYAQLPLLRELLLPTGDPDLQPERSLQSSLGIDHDFFSGLSLELTLYHARLTDLVVGREDRFVFILGPPPTAPLDTAPYANTGSGHSYGAESLLRYETPRFSGWLGATVSRATRVKRPGQEPALFEYDQPLVLTAVGSYKLPRKLTLGLRLRYASGNPYTPVGNRGFDLTDHTYYPIYAADNTARMPAFWTIDARLDKGWTFEKWTLTGYVDLLNATNRKNVELINWSYDWSKELRVYGLPILPIVGLRGEW